MNTSRMQLSIVIPTFNEASNMSRLLPYLRTHADATETEIIVVNACKTTDDTAKIAQAEGAIVYTCMDCCRAAQMNLGASKARFDTLYFVHADVLPPSSFAEDIAQALAAGNVFGWFSYQFDSPSRLLKINARNTRRDGIFAGGGDQTLFIRKKDFQTLRGFRTDYRIMEDFEFVKRAKRAGLPYTIVLHDVLVSARKYEQNSYLKVNLVNLLMFGLFYLRCPQTWMKRIYKKFLR